MRPHLYKRDPSWWRRFGTNGTPYNTWDFNVGQLELLRTLLYMQLWMQEKVYTCILWPFLPCRSLYHMLALSIRYRKYVSTRVQYIFNAAWNDGGFMGGTLSKAHYEHLQHFASLCSVDCYHHSVALWGSQDQSSVRLLQSQLTGLY